jgi:hypothetical protein
MEMSEVNMSHPREFILLLFQRIRMGKKVSNMDNAIMVKLVQSSSTSFIRTATSCSKVQRKAEMGWRMVASPC